MITTDEDVKMILMLYYSQAVCVSIYFCHSMPLLVYTLISVIILRSLAIDIRDSTGTVIYALTIDVGGEHCSNNVGLRPMLIHGAMRKHNVQQTHSTLVLVTTISMHALLDLHTKLASSAARTAS